MTFEDVKVIGLGSIALLCLFLFASLLMNRVDVWAIVRRYVTVHLAENGNEHSPVYIPVSGIGMEANNTDAAVPDMDAQNAGIPHFNRDITDSEWIMYMAVARTKDRKYRFSANAIYAAVGGDRNTVLARIREIRATKPAPQYIQADGNIGPATYPVTGRN